MKYKDIARVFVLHGHVLIFLTCLRAAQFKNTFLLKRYVAALNALYVDDVRIQDSR